MSLILEGSRRFHVASAVALIEEGRELAWAEKYIQTNPALAWLVGKYVEADRTNNNGQTFRLNDLQEAQKTLHHAPLNWAHRPEYIVGHFVASDLVYPTQEESASDDQPFVEALAVFYKYYFGEEYRQLEKAHAQGASFLSMEAIPETLTCLDCSQTVAYDGRTSPRYCACLNGPGARKVLNKPHFTAGGLILPPVKPGWSRADITQVSSWMKQHAQEVEAAYDHVQSNAPDGSPKTWEEQMLLLLRIASKETV